MSIADKKLKTITEQDLLDLITEQEPEGRRIDYKRDLYADTNDDKFEFRYDVVAFANTGGGDLVIGMAEENRLPVSLPGVALPDADGEMRRLSQILEYKIWPRVTGVDIHPVPLSTGNYALIVRIPATWYGPHAVERSEFAYKFPHRSVMRREWMDGSDIRRAIEGSFNRTQRLRVLRNERISAISQGNTSSYPTNTPADIESGRRMLVLHLIPLSALDGPTLDLSQLRGYPGVPRAFRFSEMRPGFNLDGFVTVYTHGGRTSGYVQVFRSGVLEAVDGHIVNNDRSYIRPDHEKFLIDRLPDYILMLRNIGVRGPLFAGVTLVNAHGVNLVPRDVDPNDLSNIGQTNLRHVLIIPEVELDSLESEPAIELRDTFEVIWNAFGWPRAMSYDKDGKRLGSG